MIFQTKSNMPGIPKYLDSNLDFVLSLQSGSSNYSDSNLDFPSHLKHHSSQTFKIITVGIAPNLA